MGKIHDRIAELEAALTNCRSDHEGYELASMEEQLFRLRHIEELWNKLGDTTINPETEEIETEFNGFPPGTHREEIWEWFEDVFDISVAEDLMGL